MDALEIESANSLETWGLACSRPIQARQNQGEETLVPQINSMLGWPSYHANVYSVIQC